MRGKHCKPCAAIALISAVLFIIGCGEGDDTTASPNGQPTTTTKPKQQGTSPFRSNPAEAKADTYALDVAERETGERRRAGCLDASKASADGSSYEVSEEAITDAGCIYSAAFAGCREGQLGRRIGPLPAAQEWPEKELLAINRKARQECAA